MVDVFDSDMTPASLCKTKPGNGSALIVLTLTDVNWRSRKCVQNEKQAVSGLFHSHGFIMLVVNKTCTALGLAPSVLISG